MSDGTSKPSTFDPKNGAFGIGNGINEYNDQAAKKGVKPEEAGEDSPVSDTNADEAITTIGNMRSKDKVQHVIDNDKRATVVAAAKRRLAQLG
jgi:hypothetical protein